MTPVTGSITDGKKNWFILPCCPGKGFVTPGKPVNRVPCVLEEIRTLFMDKPVTIFFGVRRICVYMLIRLHTCS
jgi:hypothetical protein